MIIIIAFHCIFFILSFLPSGDIKVFITYNRQHREVDLVVV